jgi:hypothetical protein
MCIKDLKHSIEIMIKSISVEITFVNNAIDQYQDEIQGNSDIAIVCTKRYLCTNTQHDSRHCSLRKKITSFSLFLFNCIYFNFNLPEHFGVSFPRPSLFSLNVVGLELLRINSIYCSTSG